MEPICASIEVFAVGRVQVEVRPVDRDLDFFDLQLHAVVLLDGAGMLGQGQGSGFDLTLTAAVVASTSIFARVTWVALPVLPSSVKGPAFVETTIERP